MSALISKRIKSSKKAIPLVPGERHRHIRIRIHVSLYLRYDGQLLEVCHGPNNYFVALLSTSVSSFLLQGGQMPPLLFRACNLPNARLKWEEFEQSEFSKSCSIGSS
jgi:hypothetical protein